VSKTPKASEVTDESYAQALDAADPLAPFRDRFYQLPGAIYLDGSLRIFRGF
jgi:kynureninase